MKTIAALVLALAWSLLPLAPAAWASHGGGHSARDRSAFPRSADPWRHWPPRHHGHQHDHGHGKHFTAPPSVIFVVPGRHVVGPSPVWVDAHWAWNGFTWVWIPGHWVQ